MSVPENGKSLVGLAAEDEVALCWLTVDGRLLGIDTRQIREVLGPRTVQAVPLAPAFIAGLLAYRGEVLTAVSLRCLLDLPSHSQESCVLVLDGGGNPFALVVDRVGGVVEIDVKSLVATSATLGTGSKALFCGVYRTPEGLLVQLDTNRLRPEHLSETGLLERETAGERGR